MANLFTNLVQKVVISRKWTENGPMLDREWTDEVAEKSARMSTVWAMLWVKLVNLVNFVMQIFKWTKWTKWTEQIFDESLKSLKSLMQVFVESAESAKSAKSIFATSATFASANFVGKESNERTEMYGVKNRNTTTRFRLSLGSNLSRFSLASLICLCMLTVGVGNVWGTVDATYTLSTSDNNKSNISVGSTTWAVGASAIEASSSNCKITGTISVTLPTGAVLKSVTLTKSNNWGSGAKVIFKAGSTSLNEFTAEGTFTLTSDKTNGSYSFTKGGTANKNAWVKSIKVTYYPQTAITLNANGGAANKTAKYNYSSGTKAAFEACTRDGYTCTGYWTASSGGTKILNTDGTLAAASITVSSVPYTDSNTKWAYDGATLTLYAQWTAAASCDAPSAPTYSSVSGTGVTISTTSAAANYDIYLSTSSTTPTTQDPTASTSSANSKAISDLSYGTTYYYWMRQNCGGGSTSSWVAGSPTSFTTTVPAPTGVSAGSITMDGATFTITDANNVNNYDIYYNTNSTAPVAGTTPSTTSTSKTKAVSGLAAGTYYYWVRAKGPNAKSDWVGGSTFTTLTLSSISVSTAPTKVKYLEGDNFDPTALVITRTYTNSTSDTYTYAGHTSEFSFSPATNTSLTTSNTSVTITYGGQTTSQSINVYTVTVSKVNMSGTAISAVGVTASCSGRTLSQSVGSTNYKFNSYVVTAGGVSLSGSNITGTPTGNVTINAKFHDPITVTWKVGSGAASGGTGEVKYGTAITALPSTPADNALASCGTNKFMGWSKNELTGTGNSAPADLFTTTGGATALTANTIYRAVFASSTSGAAANTVLFEEPFTGMTADTKPTAPGSSATVYGSATITYTFTDGTGTSSGTTAIKNEALTQSGSAPEVMVGKKGTSSGAAGGKVVISGIPNGNASALTVSYTQNGNALSATASGTGYSGSTSGSSKADKSFDVTVSSNADATLTLTFQATSTSNVRLDDIQVKVKTAGTTYADYQTGCCTPLGYINPSVVFTDPTTAVLTWNAMSNVDGTTPYTITYRTGSDEFDDDNVGSITTNGAGKKTCTITGLSCNTNYDFKIAVKAADGYCDKDTTMTGKNSGKWEITLTDGGTPTGGTYITGATGNKECDGEDVDLTAEAADGYAFSGWAIVDSGDDDIFEDVIKTGDADDEDITITMPADNITVTATFSCVTPTFGTNLSTTPVNYWKDDTPSSLTVAATASGATVNYQWQKSSDNSIWTNDGTNSSSNTSYAPSTAAKGTMYYRCVATNAACGSTQTSNVATIVVAVPSCDYYSFHYGTRKESDWNDDNYCFESSTDGDGNSGYYYYLADFEIPNKPHYYVGWKGSWNTSDAKSADADFEDMVFGLLRANSCTYQALGEVSTGNNIGAIGTLRIRSSYTDDNKYIDFIPAGYVLRIGSGDSWTSTALTGKTSSLTETVFESDLVTLNASTQITSKNFYVGLKTSSDYVWNPTVSESTAMTNMGVVNGKDGSGDPTWRATNLAAGDDGKNGKFRIWADNCNKNWNCHFVLHHVLTYDANGGSGAPAKQSVAADAANVQLTVSSTEPTRSGYTFLGWNESSSATSPDGDWDGGDTHAMSGDVTLYAVWAANHTLSYSLDGGDGSCSGGTYYTGQSFTACNNPGDKTGHTFTGWLGSNSTSYTAGTTYTMPDANLTLTAQWSVNSYDVTLTTNGGTINAGDVSSYTYGVGATLPTNVTRDGYRFDGWFDNVGLTGSAVTTISTTATGDKEYYAKWTQVYTVTWYVSGEEWESGVVAGNTIVPAGTKVSALPTAPTKSDCDDKKKFMGWRSSTISSSTDDKPSGLFNTKAGSPTISANTNFYAVFADVTGGDTIVLKFPDDNSSSNGLTSNQYTSTWTAKSGDDSWSISNFNNNNWAGSWKWIRCGRKSTASTATITSGALGMRVDSIYLTMDAITASGVDTMKLFVDDNSSFSSPAVIGVKKQATTHALKIASPAKDQYYKFEFTCNNSVSSNGFIQISKIVYKQKLDTVGYVTTCPACTAAPTFNETYAAVSEIGCDSAIVTATDGLATLGTGEGCNIREYGFVWGTSSTPTLRTGGYTDKYSVSKNINEDTEFSCEMEDLTSGTQYYVRAYAINKSDTAYTTAKSFYTKGVSSIAITTAPTRTKYIAGEIFDPTGMVVTATLPSGGTEDVTADCTFSPDLETALSTLNTSVTVGYSPCSEDLSKTQAINVYSMTVSEGDNAGYGSYEYTTGATFSVTPSTGKTYTLAVTNGTAVDNLDGTHTITNPTGNVTVTINYRNAETVKVYYKFDGNTVITQDVTESTTATLPTASDLATAIANNDLELPEGTPYTNFYGWSESEFTPQTDEPTIVNSPTINATKTFYAVYSNINKIRIDEEVITSGSYPSSEQTLTLSSKDFKYHYICKQTTNLQFKSNSTQFGYLYNSSALGYIRKIEVGASGSNDFVPVYACSAANTISGSALTDEDISDYKYVYLFPENTQYFKIKGDNSYTYKVNYIDVFYSSATPYYMTTFCDDKIGAPTVTATKVSTASNKATVTLSWDEVSGATGYKVKWGSVSNDWEDVGTERTYVKENVSTGTTKWFVKAKYNEANYCGAEIAKGSTTVSTAYSVTYDANLTGSTGDVPAVSWFEPSLSVTVSTNELAKSRYHWDGWKPYNASTEAEITVTTGAFTMPSANVTVKGQWAEVLSGDEVYITSAKDITTMSSMDIAVERTTYKSGTMTISDETGDQGGTFHAVITGAVADASDGLDALVKIEYTPTKANVTESATMTAVIGSESYDFTVYGRSLPADFVIVAKVGAAWTALPADATSAGLQQGYSLTLDNTTTPTKATLAPESAVFNYYAKSAKTTDYIRLAGKDNSKALWGNATNNIKMNAAIGGGYATGDAYEWKLATTDNATYTLYNDNSSRYLGVNSDKKWGTHSVGNTASKVLYFLPVDATADHIGMTVTSWGDNMFTFTTSDDIPDYDHVAVECNGDSYSATMTGSGPYTITISSLMDFEDYSGASLVVQWQDNENTVLAQGAVLLPIFITGDNTDFEGYDPDILAVTDVHITNGSTLTITGNVSVHDLSIEGGSTLNISTTGGGAAVTFSMNSLYLRGGWNETYSSYDVPRVYIDPKSTLTKSQNTVYFDISVDSRNYYPIAVPFRVRVKDIDYANSTLAYYSVYGPTGQYVIKEYDGARRAENGPDQANNWKVVPQEDGSGNDVYLEPGRGYILTAVSLPSYGGGIIRFPMSFTNAWTALGEQGTVSAVTKNVVAVTAYSGAATAGDKKVNKGWNLLGVPFMSCYATAGDDDDNYLGGSNAIIQGKYDFKTNTWKNDEIRYVNVPTHDFSEYIQSDITESETVLRPGWCFMVQIDDDGDLTFMTAGEAENSSLPIYAPKREQASMPVEKTGIILSGAEASDKTTFLISDKYSSDYEIGEDLEKLFGNAFTLATYSLNNGTKLAYNAMSTSQAQQTIPIGVRIPADGEYTFSLNSRYAEANIERLDLIDYQTGELTNLMTSEYTFTATQGENNERFALNVTMKRETPTDVENIQGDDVQNTKVQKLILDDKLYIIRDGKMYDATGKRVTEINK